MNFGWCVVIVGWCIGCIFVWMAMRSSFRPLGITGRRVRFEGGSAMQEIEQVELAALDSGIRQLDEKIADYERTEATVKKLLDVLRGVRAEKVLKEAALRARG